MRNRTLRRREFLGSTAKAALAAAAAPMLVRSGLFGAEAPSTKLNIAGIGLGGQMQGLMKEVLLFEQNIVAFCDVDTNRIEASRKNLGDAAAKAREYKDYRELLEREKSVDAVVIATPDHWHAAISGAAIRAGKHVYCEKPLTHTVGEARQLRELSKQSKVATQTGNQGSASSSFRRSMELIQAGVLGRSVRFIFGTPAMAGPAAKTVPPERIQCRQDWIGTSGWARRLCALTNREFTTRRSGAVVRLRGRLTRGFLLSWLEHACPGFGTGLSNAH